MGLFNLLVTFIASLQVFMGQVSTIGVFWRRYRVSILFPTFSIGAIVADYTHTLKYKKSLADIQKQQQKELE